MITETTAAHTHFIPSHSRDELDGVILREVTTGQRLTSAAHNDLGGVIRDARQNLAELGASNAAVVGASFTGVHDRICDSTGKLVHEIDRVGDATALAACRTNDAIADSKLFNAVQFKDSVIAQNVGFSAATVQAAAIGSAAQVLATAFAGQARDQATSNFNLATIQIERVRAELAASQAAGFSAAALLAFQNKADSDAKAAECCCELKALITAEGVATRGLANEIEARRVQNELIRLQTQVTVLTGGVLGARAAG